MDYAVIVYLHDGQKLFNVSIREDTEKNASKHSINSYISGAKWAIKAYKNNNSIKSVNHKLNHGGLFGALLATNFEGWRDDHFYYVNGMSVANDKKIELVAEYEARGYTYAGQRSWLRQAALGQGVTQLWHTPLPKKSTTLMKNITDLLVILERSGYPTPSGVTGTAKLLSSRCEGPYGSEYRVPKWHTGPVYTRKIEVFEAACGICRVPF